MAGPDGTAGGKLLRASRLSSSARKGLSPQRLVGLRIRRYAGKVYFGLGENLGAR